MESFTVRPDELRTTATHLGEAAERLRAMGDVTAVPPGDLGGPAPAEAAGELLERWTRAAVALDDLTTSAADRLLRCARAYETTDEFTLRSLGLL